MPELLSDCEPVPGRITVERQDGERELRLAGEVDAGVVAAFLDRQSAAQTSEDGVDGPPPVTALDLAEVTFLSSAAVSFLVQQTQPCRAVGNLPALRGVTQPARRVMEITRVVGLFRSAA